MMVGQNGGFDAAWLLALTDTVLDFPTLFGYLQREGNLRTRTCETWFELLNRREVIGHLPWKKILKALFFDFFFLVYVWGGHSLE